MLKCFYGWFIDAPQHNKVFIYLFAVSEKQAQFFFDRAFGLMYEYSEKLVLYKEEKDFLLKHQAGEIWGTNVII